MLSDKILERFINYVQIHTTSNSENADKGLQPSTPEQNNFAAILEKELHNIGITDVSIFPHAYVCARIPATSGYENVPSIGFLAHMDTSEEVSGLNVKPIISKNEFNETIIHTDGSTLLGADDKAGIASIISAIDAVLNGFEKSKEKILPLPHGQLEIIFSPDEETGHGMDNVPLSWIQSKACYTVDGGGLGELECECFNAYKSVITFTGFAKHTGTARPDMINAITMASSFINFLPQNESPEATDGYLGFYAPMEISGSIETSSVTIFLRDFSTKGMQRRINAIDTFASAIKAKFPGSDVQVVHTQQYLNMKEKLDIFPDVMKTLIQAAKNIGINPILNPIRGGTDGSRLTELGIPTPNIFTGGHNYHSRSEWASLEQMTKSCETIIELIKLWSEK